MVDIHPQPVAPQPEDFQSTDVSTDVSTQDAVADASEQHLTYPTFGRKPGLIRQARKLAQQVESLPAKDIIDLSGYLYDKGLGDNPGDFILTGPNPKMPMVRIHPALRWWIPNLVYSRLCRLLKLKVLGYSVATHAPAELEMERFVVVCPYFTEWIPMEEWQEMPQDERVNITNPTAFSAHVALEFLVHSTDSYEPFGYVLPNGTFLRNPSTECFSSFYLALAVDGHEEQWRGMYHSELDEPRSQMRWDDYRKAINECNVSPSAVAKLLENLATLTDVDLISCVCLPDFPHRERVQSILLSGLLRTRKAARNYLKKVHELTD